MANDGEDFIRGFASLIVTLVLGSAFVVFVGVVVIPAVILMLCAIYYIRNVHIPGRRKSESEALLRELEDKAKRIKPPLESLLDRLDEEGINDPVVVSVATKLLGMEGLEPPARPAVLTDEIIAARYQEDLQLYVNNASASHYALFCEQLIYALGECLSNDDGEGLFQSRRRRTPQELEEMIMRFINEDGVFRRLTEILNRNLNEANDVMPSDSKLENYGWAYLKNTPLLDLEYVEQSVSLENRMYHTYLLGSSGSGKTNLIENIVAHDLTSGEDCCVVVIDSQTQLTEKLAACDIPDTTYITPKWDLALNLFDVGYHEMRNSGIEGETLINKTVGLLSFVMEGMMGVSFTPPQRTIFQYAIQLVISIPGGNIFTFMDVLSDDGHKKFRRQIDQFDDNTRRFFEKDFGSDEYRRSREAIRRRLDGLLLNPTFRRLFSSTENKFDMARELRTKRLILIDTNKPMLDNDASAFFGRLFIAMILRASHMRFTSGGRPPRPVYLVVDEAHEYFDRSIADMLEQARKANIGMIVAHQSLSQAKGSREDGRSNIADPLMVNTATKIIWTNFREDAAKFAGSMPIKPEDILNLPQYTFGMYSRQRGWTPIRGRPNALGALPRRQDPYELQDHMEMLYGPSHEPAVNPFPQERPWIEQPRPSEAPAPAPVPPSNHDLPERDII